MKASTLTPAMEEAGRGAGKTPALPSGSPLSTRSAVHTVQPQVAMPRELDRAQQRCHWLKSESFTENE